MSTRELCAHCRCFNCQCGTTEERLDRLEREIKEAIAYHQQCYQRAIDPLMSQLVRLDNLRPRRYLVPLAQAIAAGLVKP